jgi:hypothetical protein
MVIKNLRFWLIAGMCALGWETLAQPQFIARADRYTVGKHEEVTVTFTINEQASGFVAPSFKDFVVLQGPSHSQSTVMRNFQMEFNISISYVLRPRKTGTLTIEPARIKVGKETLETKTLEIKVVEGAPQSEDPNDPNTIARKAAYPRVRVSKKSVYVGEPFIASYQLVNNPSYGVNQPNILELPEYSGAYKGEIKGDGTANAVQEFIDGQSLQVYTLIEHLIIPQKSGTFSPGNIVMEIPTQIPTNQYDFFGRRYVQTVKQIGEAKFPSVEVKPLPTANKPADFSGAVGQYKLDVKLSRKEVKANESVSLEIRIQGFGNVKLAEMPLPDLPATIEVFDPKVTEKIREYNKGMEGSKAHEYLLLPRYRGTYKIPPVRFSFFDPVAGRYQTLTSEPLTIEVTDGPEALAGQGGSASGGPGSMREKEKVTFLGKDILYIKTHPGKLVNPTNPLLLRPIFPKLLALPFILMGGIALLGFWFRKRGEDRNAVAFRTASKALKAHLAMAETAQKQGNPSAFYAALERALWGFLEVRFELPKSKQTAESLQEKMLASGISNELGELALTLLKKCEQARYMPASDSDMQADFKLANECFTQLRKS